jgi:lysyl-tRNA synthetase class 2
MLKDLIDERLKKRARLEEAKIDPYPARIKRSFAISEAIEKFPALLRGKKKVFLVGRVTSVRDQGKVLFVDIKEGDSTIQGVLKKDELKNFAFIKSTLDRGDFISLGGALFKTKRGERSIAVRDFAMAAKSVRPVPSEWYGVEEMETRLRKRYLDILLNPGAKEIFLKKAVFWDTLRSALKAENFLEVETAVLEPVPGGADAEPFVTHMNALDHDFYLRISLELPLKKLIVGGLEKVFEIGRIFRNEGIDKEHLQDYTQLEFYWAYSDYNELMKFVEKLYKQTIKATFGKLVTTYEGKKINWGKKWKKVDYVAALKKTTGLDPLAATRAELFAKAQALHLSPEPKLGRGRLIDLLFKKTVRPKLAEPCFLVDPPVDIEPLAKRSNKDPRRVERFQVVACGTELGKGFSELNDPVDQRKRFEEQMQLRESGDKEAQRLDESFLEALEYGLPPTAGFGMSERLFAVLMDKPVRETVIFPLMRPPKE